KEKRKKRTKQLLRRFAHGRHSKILFTDAKLFTVEQVENDRVHAVSNLYATIWKLNMAHTERLEAIIKLFSYPFKLSAKQSVNEGIPHYRRSVL
ncbi:hypothetical protein TELCIR_19536, partial [Teladorsagia circumcincta]